MASNDITRLLFAILHNDALISQRQDYSQSFYIAREFTVTLVYLNSSLNPVVYCWKMKEVKRAVKDTLKQSFSCICCT